MKQRAYVYCHRYQENEQTDAEALEQPKDTEVHEGTGERKEDLQSGDTDTSQSDRPVDGKPKGVDSGTGNTKIDRQYGTPNPRKEEVYERNKIEIRNAWYALQNNGLREQLEAQETSKVYVVNCY